MGEAGAGQLDMGAILMIDRGEQFAGLESDTDVDSITLAGGGDRFCQADLAVDGMQRKGADAVETGNEMSGVTFGRNDGPDAVFGAVLQQTQCHEKLSSRAPIRGAGIG
ncbi:hypothetical protein SSCI18S_03141 [Sphingobium scionense]